MGDAGEVRRIATDMTKRRRIISRAGSGWPSLPTKTRNTTRPSRFLKMFLAGIRNTSMAADCKAMCCWQKAIPKKRSKFWSDWTKPIQTFPSSNINLARAYLHNNNINQAKLALDQAVSLNPNYDDAVLLLAQINLSTGHGEAVIEPMTRLLKRRPDLKNAALVLVGAYGSLDRFDDAAVVLEEQAKLAPNDPQPLIALGLTYRQAKRNDEARQAFEKAAQLSPDNLSLVVNLSN